MEKVKDIRIERLEKLKQATIVNDGAKINFNNKLELYDSLLDEVFKGNFDDIFLTNKLDNLNSEERAKIFDLARRYKALCFFEGDSVYWLDSVEGVYLSDLDLVTTKILDNYDFLLDLANKGGEDALIELSKFQNTDMYYQKAIIDYLRNTFINDDILINTIISMSGKDDKYKSFTTQQKALLCLDPEGVIYKSDKDSIEMINPNELIKKIKINFLGEDNDNYHIENALKQMNLEDFNELVNPVYESYQSNIARK